MTRIAPHLASPAALDELRALNARFIHNYVTNDVTAHDAMLHHRFQYIRGNGARVDRATYLAGWATGFDPEVVVYWDTRDEHITLIGPVALVSATNQYTERHGAVETTGMAAYTDTYLFDNGVWLCIQAQITPVAPEHWPAEATIISIYRKGIRQTR